MLVNIIQNTISSFRSALAAAEVITTNLKMWLGFETSETLGIDEVVDGGFSNQSNWTTTGGFSVSGNAANCDGTNDSLVFQSISSLNNGDTIKVTFDVENYVSGTVRCGAGAGLQQPFGLALTGNVIGHTEIITKTSAIVAFGFRSYSFQGSVTNLKVQKLTQITPDKSGNNNVGELFTGKALDFNGSTDYVDVDGFQMAGTNATFAFWFNSNDTLGRFFDIITGFNNRFILSFNNNQISILDDTVSWFNFGSVTTNVWNRCVITINGTTAKCFVNGVQLGTDKTISTIDFSSSTDAAIGSMVFGTQSYFDGSLSDFQIYNSAWSTDDIAFDYANPNILVTDSTNTGTSIAVTNLKAYWAMSEGAGSLAYDSSGEGNNGTINGATYEPDQPSIPQLGMMNFSNGAVATGVTLIPDPNNTSEDIDGNAVRDRLNSFNLDGTGYAEVADDTDLDFGTGDFTLECWAKYDFLNQGSGFNVLVSNGSMSTSGSGLSLGSSITKFEVRLNAGTAVTKSFGTDDMTVGNWYHLVVTREGTSLKTYRDTTIKSSSTIASVNIDTSLPVRIGRDTNSNRFYQNLISDVRLYDRALTSDEIENNYNAGLSAHTN